MALNFDFPTTATAPVPFTISVDGSFVSEAVTKAGLYRPSIDLVDGANENWIEGPPSENMTALAEYWATEYNWDTEQDYINNNFSHYAVVVSESPEWPHTVPLHFIHERAEDDDAFPLLLLHGWPSTSLEWLKVIEPLVLPSDSSQSGYHVVAPDLPGYGFSPAPEHSGFNPVAVASVIDTFMGQLGYDHYGIVTTDVGWPIGMRMVEIVPEGRIAGHFTDFFHQAPNETDMARYESNQTTEEETEYIASFQSWSQDHVGYQHTQGMVPLTAGQVFSDSPVGWAGWVWHLMIGISDNYPYTFDEIITTAFVLFIQGTYGNIRYYREFVDFDFVKTTVPTGVSQWSMGVEGRLFPDIASATMVPRDWLERLANIRQVYRHDAGGHFPAVSMPEKWAADVKDFFSRYIDTTPQGNDS